MRGLMLLCTILLFIEQTAPSSGVKVAVAVNSSCGSDPWPPPSSIIIHHSPVTLTCCVEMCTLWYGRWYKRIDNGTDQYLSSNLTLTVTLTEPKEMYICIVEAINPACYNDPYGNGSVTLIQCLPPNISPVNDTNTNATNNVHVVVYFKVKTDEFIIGKPIVRHNSEGVSQRWLIKYYAVSDTGIGDEIQNISTAYNFYIGLETISTFSPEYDDGRYDIQVKSSCGKSRTHIVLKGTCNDFLPPTFLEKPKRLNWFTVAGRDVLLHFKYKGVHITTFWMVNHTTDLTNIPYIRNNNVTLDNESVCEEVHELTLLNVTRVYNGDYTAFVCRGAFDATALNLTIHLRVCELPLLHDTKIIGTSVITLQWIFAACHDIEDLMLFNRTGPRNISDGRYTHYHYIRSGFVVFNWTIYNVTSNDSGNYTCTLQYNQSMIPPPLVESEEVPIYLNISSNESTPTPLDSVWIVLIGSLAAVLIVASLVVLVHYRKRHMQGDYQVIDDDSAASACSSFTTLTSSNRSNDRSSEGSGSSGNSGDVNQLTLRNEVQDDAEAT